MPEQSPGGRGRGPSQRAKEGPEGGQRARRASTARIPSRELEGGTAGRTPGKAARGAGCAGVRRQSTHPVTLKQSVPFLSHPPPRQPTPSLESLILDCFTQRPALPASGSTEM